MQFTFTPKIKRLIVIITCVIILAAVGWLLYIFFNQATLTITTKSTNGAFTLFRSNPDRQTYDLTPENGTVTVRVPAGSYSITLLDGSNSTQQVVDLKSGDNKTVALNIQQPGIVEPVSSMSASFMSASKDRIRFVNRIGNYGLYTIDESNKLQLVDGTRQYQSAYWSDPSFGVAKVLNSSGDRQLVAIDGDTIKIITLPFTDTATLSYAISTNRDIYISDGHTVYSGTVEEGFNKIYSSGDQVTINAASTNAVVFSQQGPASERTTGIVVLQKDGKKFQMGGELYKAAWSASGNRLVTSGDTSEVFDASLKRISVLPQGNVSSPVWIDDDHLVYGSADKVWMYTISTGHAAAIASVGGTGVVSQLMPSIEGDYLYISMQKTDTRRDTQFRLMRVGLNGQPTLNTLAQGLSALLPTTSKGCKIGYTNFLRTSITVASPECVATARQFLSTYKFNLNSIDFNIVK